MWLVNRDRDNWRNMSLSCFVGLNSINFISEIDLRVHRAIYTKTIVLVSWFSELCHVCSL